MSNELGNTPADKNYKPSGVNAPNKIYLGSNTEYIRKDILVDWANEMLSKPYDRTTESAFEHRFAKVLIDKINSL